MKKALSVLLLFVFVFTLTACGTNGNNSDNNDKPEINLDMQENAGNTEEDIKDGNTDVNSEVPPETKTDLDEVQIDYGASEIYSKEDMDLAIGIIKDKFVKWRGCDVHSISYGGDDKNIEDNIAWANDCIEGQNFTEVMEFETDFHSPTEVSGEWGDSDTEYDDYQWWFARTDGGDWKLFYWSY